MFNTLPARFSSQGTVPKPSPCSSRPTAPKAVRPAPVVSAKSSNMPSTGSTKLMNSPDTLVQNALDGLLMSNPHLTKLDGFPDVSLHCCAYCGQGG